MQSPICNKTLLLVWMLIPLSNTAFSQSNWRMEVHTGSAYNVDTNLRIDPGYDLTAHYATNAFEGGPYYSVRFGKWRDQNGWEVEFLHHKVYLENTPAGIQTF